MNRFLLLLFLFLFPLALFSQYSYDNSNLKKHNSSMQAPATINDSISKFSFRFNSGFMFSNWGASNHYCSYISPEFGYDFTKNFSLSLGLVFNNQPNLYFSNTPYNDAFMMSNANSFLVYYRGEYFVNDNFRLSSVGVFDLSNDFAKNGLNHANFALDYNFGNGFSLHAEVNYFNLKQFNPCSSPYGIYNSFHPAAFFHSPYGGMIYNDPFRIW